jgi:hypothetical protein
MPHNWEFKKQERNGDDWKCETCGVGVRVGFGIIPDPVKMYTIAYGPYTCEEIVTHKVQES